MQEKYMSQEIVNVLADFSLVTGISTVIVENNNILRNNIDCGFCKQIRTSECGQNYCDKSYLNASLYAMRTEQPYIYKCHAGLGAFAIPVKYRDMYFTVICRQILMMEPENIFWEEIRQVSSRLNINNKLLQKEVKKLNIINIKKVKAAVNILYSLLQYNNMANENKQEKLELEKIRLLIDSEIKLKEENTYKSNKKFEKYKIYYGYRELIAAIKIGRREEASRLINQALAIITENYSDSLMEFKTRIIELVLRISREVAEFSTDYDAFTSIGSGFVKEALGINDSSVLCNCVNRTVNDYIDLVANKKIIYKYQFIVQHATRYINNNIERELSIDEIARTIHVSPFYLCRTFKEIMNCTLKQYIIRIKIEKAKINMLNMNLSLNDICERVGYKNNRHFVAMFKKVEGVTPYQYRKKIIDF